MPVSVANLVCLKDMLAQPHTVQGDPQQQLRATAQHAAACIRCGPFSNPLQAYGHRVLQQVWV